MIIKKLIIFLLKQVGYSLEKIPRNSNAPFLVNILQQAEHDRSSPLDRSLTMTGAIERCVDRGLNVNSVIDIGASDGRWSKDCMMFLPNAKYLLIEALDAHKNDLIQFKKENPNVDFVLAAAGRTKGKVYFYDNGSIFGGVASENILNKDCIKLPAVTVDEEVEKYKLPPPYLIKLDTHGFEVPILEGALETIKKAELIIIETYNHKLTSDCLKYYEMCDYMEKLGFSTVEIVNVMLREYDDSLWQMDTFFIRSDRKEFKSLATQKE